MEGWINGGRGFQGRFYPSGRQRVVIGRTYKSLTRQITRQEPSATRQVFIRHCFLQGWIVLPRRGGIDLENASSTRINCFVISQALRSIARQKEIAVGLRGKFGSVPRQNRV